MKRFHVVGLALLAIVAVGAFGAIGAVAHKSKKSVATTVTVVFTPGEPAGGSGQIKDGTFSGKVGSTKPPCLDGPDGQLSRGWAAPRSARTRRVLPTVVGRFQSRTPSRPAASSTPPRF